MGALNYTPEWIAANKDTFNDLITCSMSGKRPFRTLMAQSAAVSSWSASRLAKLGIPVLVVHGDKDVVLPASNGQKIAAQIPSSQYVELPGAGHAFWHMVPESATIISSFIARHDERTPSSKL